MKQLTKLMMLSALFFCVASQQSTAMTGSGILAKKAVATTCKLVKWAKKELTKKYRPLSKEVPPIPTEIWGIILEYTIETATPETLAQLADVCKIFRAKIKEHFLAIELTNHQEEQADRNTAGMYTMGDLFPYADEEIKQQRFKNIISQLNKPIVYDDFPGMAFNPFHDFLELNSVERKISFILFKPNYAQLERALSRVTSYDTQKPIPAKFCVALCKSFEDWKNIMSAANSKYQVFKILKGRSCVYLIMLSLSSLSNMDQG